MGHIEPGPLLIGLGVFLFVVYVALRRRSRPRPSESGMRADRGGVVVGGDNPGTINTSTVQAPQAPNPSSSRFDVWLKRAVGIGSLLGVGVGIFVAFFN